MACFTQKSLDTMVNTLLAACQKSLKNPDINTILKRNASKFKRINFGTILTSTIAADIGEKWFRQMATNSELKRCIGLLCYYQIPYPKAASFNALASGILLISDLVTQKLKAKELATVLEYGMSDHSFALNLAVNLQRMLPLSDMKSNAMCIRPKYYKPEEAHQSTSLEFQFQRITDQYMPWLKKSFLAMGFYPKLDPNEAPVPPRPPTKGSEQREWDMLYGEDHMTENETAMKEARTLFNHSVEGGMDENEALAMLDAILVAEDILNIGENWFNFSANKSKCRNEKVISSDGGIQKQIKVMISEMFDQQTTDKNHISQATGRANDFFEKVFGKTILEDIHQEYTQGDPVQLRLFSKPNSSDESSTNAKETTAGQSTVRECHLLPLTNGPKFGDDTQIELNTAPTRRRRRKKAPQTNYKSRSQRYQDNFFSQLGAAKSSLQRMVLRMRVNPITHEITQDPSLGRTVYVNNRFNVALTIIHELMHTYFAMVDFYYRDLSFISPFKTNTVTGPAIYCGLSLGVQNSTDGSTMDKEIVTTVYPKGQAFNLDDYNWQINNVDNYTILLTKLYLMDQTLVKQRYEHGDTEAYNDKAHIATMRLNALTNCRESAYALKPESEIMDMMYNLSAKYKAKQLNMEYLTQLEEICWQRKDNRFDAIVQAAKKPNTMSKRYAQ